MQKELSILLVDDDEDEYILLKDLVRQMPTGREHARIRIEWAENVEAALEASRAKSFDLYLVDYYLGQHTGLELMREWGTMGSTTPVIFLTGQSNYEIDLATMQEGASDYLAKESLTSYVLERAIRYTLERKRSRAELEMRVQERTHELAEANRNLKEEIAARERVEQALRASEARLRVLAETTSAAIFIVQETEIRYANKAARFVTGYTPQELVQMKFWHLAHPAYQESLKQHSLILQWISGMPTRFELKIITKAGEERWVDVTAGEMDYDGHPASVITAFDITERDRAERELQMAKAELESRVQERTSDLERERARLKTVIENAPGAIIMADEEGRIVLANPMAEQIVGQTIVGSKNGGQALPLYYLDGRPYQPGDQILTRAAREGEHFTNIEMMVSLPDGQKRYILADATPVLDNHGRRSGAVGVFQDITQRKLREQEIQDLALRSEVLATLSQSFAQAGLDYQTVLDTITLKISENLSDACIIRLATDDGGWLEPVAFHFNQPEAQAAFWKMPDMLRENLELSQVGRVARTGEPLVMLNTSTEEAIQLLNLSTTHAYKRMDILSMLVEPLRSQQRIIGTLTVIRTRPSPPYTAQDEAFFADLAQRAALAIENAMLHAEVKQLALRDSLTGQYNRRAFFELGKEEIKLYHRYNQPLSVVMLDIDHFKDINDHYGHALGDQILRMIIDHCRENIRHTDILGRYGGDEYSILLPDTNVQTAQIIAERIRKAISRQPLKTDAGPVSISVSLGVTEAAPDIRDIESLLDQADQALYTAKRMGRNRVETILSSPT